MKKIKQTCIGRDASNEKVFRNVKRKCRLEKPGGTKVRVHWMRMLKVFRAEKEAKAASKAAAKAEVRLVGMRLAEACLPGDKDCAEPSDGTQAGVMHPLRKLRGQGIWLACVKTACQVPSTQLQAVYGM